VASIVAVLVSIVTTNNTLPSYLLLGSSVCLFFSMFCYFIPSGQLHSLRSFPLSTLFTYVYI